MNQKIYNYLGYALILMVLSFAFGVYSYVGTYARSVQPSSFRSFTVQGEGKVTSIPDVAKFTFSVVTEGGKDIAKLQKDNTDKMNKAIDFVKANGVEAKDIKTENYNLSPRYQYYECRPSMDGTSKPCPPAEIVGYSINQTVSVKIRDFSKIGDILSGVIKNGANTVSQLSFDIDDPTMVQAEARAEAIAKAKVKAELTAQAGGFTVGKLLSIDEYNAQPVYAMYSKSAEMSLGAASAPAPQIEAGSQETSVTVTLRYEIR